MPTIGTDGFTILQGVLTDDEVSRLRSEVQQVLDTKGIDKAGGTVLPNAAAEAPELAWVFCHEGIIKGVREATGLTEMVFTMEADLHRNFVSSNWHKDTGEQVMEHGYFGRDCFGSDDCAVFKVALYLQDQIRPQSCLHVRPGSFRTASLDHELDHAVVVHAGDAVLFDVRTTHRGVTPGFGDGALFATAKLLSKQPDSLSAKLRRKKFEWSGSPERLAVYFAYGKPGSDSERFAQRNMQRQLAQLPASRELPIDLIEALARQRISTVDLL